MANANSEEGRADPETLVETVPWVRRVESLPDVADEDSKVLTTLGVVNRRQHIHTVENLGYTVQRIGFDSAYGARFYCTVQ